MNISEGKFTLIISQTKYEVIKINGERKFKILKDNHAPKRGPYECFFLVRNVPELTKVMLRGSTMA